MRLHEYVERRAGEVACSLISEGYLFRSRHIYGSQPRIWFKMVHRFNGNVIEADVTPQSLQLWKNQKLIKSEPAAIRDV